MKQADFTRVANDMVEDLMKYSGALVTDYGKEHGLDNAMKCFGSALAIATGNVLSQLCFALPNDTLRAKYIADFHTMIQEAAENHKKRFNNGSLG